MPGSRIQRAVRVHSGSLVYVFEDRHLGRVEELHASRKGEFPAIEEHSGRVVLFVEGIGLGDNEDP